MAIRFCMTHQCGWYFPIHEEDKKDGRECVDNNGEKEIQDTGGIQKDSQTHAPTGENHS